MSMEKHRALILVLPRDVSAREVMEYVWGLTTDFERSTRLTDDSDHVIAFHCYGERAISAVRHAANRFQCLSFHAAHLAAGHYNANDFRDELTRYARNYDKYY